jgi:hypothetical protein
VASPIIVSEDIRADIADQHRFEPPGEVELKAQDKQEERSGRPPEGHNGIEPAGSRLRLRPG